MIWRVFAKIAGMRLFLFVERKKVVLYMPNTVVLTMFREDFKHLIALAHKFRSEKVLSSLPDVRVFMSNDDSVIHAVFPDIGTRRTHHLVNFVEGDVDYETPFHILVFSPSGEQVWEHFWLSEDDSTDLLDSVADVEEIICGENYLFVGEVCSE